MLEQELIWVLDSDNDCVEIYRQILSLQYKMEVFSNVEEVLARLRHGDSPSLLICDPVNCHGSFDRAYRPTAEAGEQTWAMPECMIVSGCDDLDVIRFYFKAGVKEFILKPIRSGEMIAKVERVLQMVSNRAVIILPNSLDGIRIKDLTFREHQIFTVFLTRSQRMVRREDLYSAIWSGVSVGRKTLDVHLFNLRRKLRAHGYDIFCKDQCFTLTKLPSQTAQEISAAGQPDCNVLD